MNEQQQLQPRQQQQQQQHKMGSNTGTTGGGNTGSNSASPYMVLTQVAVPAHMMGQPNAEQLQQLQQQLQRQQQQQQSGSNANRSSQQQPPQILSFNQLPPQIQQQVLLQQQQNANTIQQQQLLKEKIQMQQQQQVKKRLSIADVQELMKGNQLDANMMKQLLAGGALNVATSNAVGHGPGNNNQSGNNNQNDSSLSDLLSSFYADSGNGSGGGGGGSTNDSNKRLFLEAQVQPVHRESNNDSIYCSDEDLFKFFDVDTLGEDPAGSSSNTDSPPATANTASDADSSNKSNPNSNNSNGVNYSFLEPTPMFQMQSTQSSSNNNNTQQQQQQQQQNGSTAHPNQVMSSSNTSQQKQQQQSSLLQQQLQQLHQQQQQAQVAMPAPSHVPSQGHFSGGATTSAPQQVPSSNNANVNNMMNTAQNFMLPSTMVPPTVLASVCTGAKGSGNKRASTDGGKKKPAAASKKAKRCDTPQDVLMRLVKQQGHGELVRIKSEDAGYDTMPSPLQLSSFGTQVVHAVHTDDVTMLGKLLACGLSPNPCNQFRDSILDLVCKRNNVAIFNCLLEHGSDIRVVDGFGRTPLHHCGWASEFSREIAEAILERDPLQLFIEDKRGQTPMEYVRADIMTDWSEFLEEMADKFWPKGGAIAKLSRPKDSRPDGTLPDPKHAVAAGLAAMISSGNISPDQFDRMDEAAKKSYG